MRRKIREMKEWIKSNRTTRVNELIKMLNQKLRGYYQYYAVTDNIKEVKRYLNAVKWLLFKCLNRRSQRRSYTIDSFYKGLLQSCPLLEPRVKVSLFYQWKPNT
jgi:hypothetical protein